MADSGPIPKRTDTLIRRNIPDVPVDKVTVIGPVSIPDLGLDDPHPLVVDLYESLKESAQKQFYEPSDWQFARLTLHFVDKLVKRENPSAQMLASVNQMLTALLITEGDRRRVRLEIERRQSNPDGDAEVVTMADLFARRLGVS